LDQILQGLVSLISLQMLGLILLGVGIGYFFGIVPGLSGLVALTLLLPFVYGMEPNSALVFLLAAHAVAVTGGSVTAILLGIPGMSPNAATLIDGFPMTQQGRGGRALGAALMSSMLGGLVGAVLLALMIPIMMPLAMSFRSPELFLVILLGLGSVIGLTQGSELKGLISAGLGMALALVGFQSITGITRFTFGTMYLWDGFKLIPLALGMFAVPLVIELAGSGTAIASKVQGDVKGTEGAEGVREGMRDVFRNFWLFLRSSVLGTVIGVLPGAGGTVASFIAYAQAKASSKEPDTFGHGNVEGVIAPESANNAKEGGSLFPTLLLGIPGSGAMAILLGAFLMVGLVPGPLFLSKHTDIAFAMVGTLVIANIIAAGFTLLLGNTFSRIALVRGNVLAPILLVVICVGAYSIDSTFMDIIMVFIFGALGYGMMKLGYNRPALFLAFILGGLAEKYFFLSLTAYGPLFLFSSYTAIVLGILVLMVFSFGSMKQVWSKAKLRH